MSTEKEKWYFETLSFSLYISLSLLLEHGHDFLAKELLVWGKLFRDFERIGDPCLVDEIAPGNVVIVRVSTPASASE